MLYQLFTKFVFVSSHFIIAVGHRGRPTMPASKSPRSMETRRRRWWHQDSVFRTIRHDLLHVVWSRVQRHALMATADIHVKTHRPAAATVNQRR